MDIAYYYMYLRYRLQKQNQFEQQPKTKSQAHITICVTDAQLVAYSFRKRYNNVFNIICLNFCHNFFLFFICLFFAAIGWPHCVDSSSKSHPHFLNAKPTQAYTQDYRHYFGTLNILYSILILFGLCVPKQFSVNVRLITSTMQ